MRSFRTSFVVVAAVAALSWTGVSRADNDVNSKKSTTTKSQTTSTTKSGSSGSSSSAKTPGTSGSSTSSSDMKDTKDMKSDTPSTSPAPSTGTGTDNPYGTGSGMTDTTVTTPPPPAQPAVPQYTTPPPPDQTQQMQQSYSTTTTSSADYDNMAGAERTTYSTRPNRPLLVTGSAIFLGTYAASAIVGAVSDLPADDKLFIPVVGPWLDLADRPCGFLDCSNSEDVNQFLLIGSGIAQGAGVAIALTSLFVPEHHESRTASARERSLAATKPTVKVLPTSVRSGGGIGAVGTF